MRNFFQRLAWYNSGLFWRTFLLLAALIVASMSAWFISIKLLERKPRAQQLSGQIISVVTITSAALTHSASDKRRELLIDLARNEGIRIYLLEENDQIEPADENPIFVEIRKLVQQKLGSQTRFAKSVNGEIGFWVSFKIDEDQYWLQLEQDRLQTESGWQFLGWATISMVFALIAAIFISRRINQPLSNLSAAARLLAQGKQPNPLSESGAREIRETNTSFNQMMQDLARIESDRTVILAGISHDLRTPLTRLQLELEMAALDPETRNAMYADLQQMDSIIQQFLDYAKPLHESTFNGIPISELLERICEELRNHPEIELSSEIEPDLYLTGLEIEFQRLVNNLVQNALRYGRRDFNEKVVIEISCMAQNSGPLSGIVLIFRDHGPGVPEHDIPRLLRPFTRGEVARSQANGSGLGLAIVDRIIKRHGGHLKMRNHEQGGLEIRIEFQHGKKMPRLAI
ncbi:HAMP domain-containing protein [Undibacterium sp. FT137W]|uniref:histidine kinase n=2 Tax=Undibacterium fentianense TaxID=2828728 RepID=A0A941DXN3_9BURK|nr:HAMP domain-containing protein [Undibacterium fentianense]